jgi:cell division protein FtsB|tara:strand:+ start:180 stop:374 length:195 start_codon:yes stop_codon:yes gene_type:complete
MINAIRQYRHNDSDDFLIGYDCEEVNKVYEAMNKRITELEADNKTLTRRNIELTEMLDLLGGDD